MKHTLAEERAINAAEAVKNLYAGRPVATRVVARQLNRPADTVKRWLDAAEQMNLVCKPDSRMGWMPV